MIGKTYYPFYPNENIKVYITSDYSISTLYLKLFIDIFPYNNSKMKTIRLDMQEIRLHDKEGLKSANHKNTKNWYKNVISKKNEDYFLKVYYHS